ncbi:MAG TPA: hypothetical protein VLK23_17500 [Thermodesulfobacteriota bacterium]|nr:hypothetical protein [Thermodesulfobacteriota bacterium]
MKKCIYVPLVSVLVVLSLVSLGGCVRPLISPVPLQYSCLSESQTPGQNPNAPVIRHACAIDRGIYGTILRIYLEADDPNGNMSKIATTVDQVSYGRYPTDFIMLKPQYRKAFRGYIQWHTFSPSAERLPEWNYVTVRVAVMDMKGNTSNEFEFRFTFETGDGPEPKPPAPFDQGDLPKLGNVSINLYNPFHDGGGADNRD